MSGSGNKVILIGNLGADPEVRTFGNGGKVAKLRLATSETWTDKQSGEKREKAEWHSVEVFGEGLVSVIERYGSKGSKLYIEGQLTTEKWQDRDGNDRYTTKVKVAGPNSNLTMLDGRKESGGQRNGDYDMNQDRGAPSSGYPRDAEVPF